MSKRLLLSHVFDDLAKPAIDRVLATTFFGDAPGHLGSVASLATHRSRIAAATGLVASTASPSTSA